jgi:hypothetical protein
MDEDVELTYTVTIRTYGDAEKLRQDMGKRLAKICELSFMDVSVEEDIACIDSRNYTVVS